LTVDQHRRGLFTCLSTDTKPSGIQSTFAYCIESDTNKIFVTFNNGTAWAQINLAAAQLTGTVSLTTQVTGTLPVANGGTNATSLTGLTLPAPVLPGLPKTKKIGQWWGRGNLNTQSDGVLSGLTNIFGNAHTTTIDTTGLYSLESCSSSANNLTGMRWLAYTCRGLNPVFECKFKMTQTASCRMYLGFNSNVASNPTTTADPLNTFTGCLFAYDSGVSANWYIHHNNAAGSNTIDTTVAADTNTHTLNITAVDATPSFIVSLDGSVITNGTVTGDIPNQTNNMGLHTYMESLSTTSPTFRLYWVWVQQDG